MTPAARGLRPGGEEPQTMMSTPAGSCHAHKKRSEATKQQDGARRQWNVRNQHCRDSGEDDDRNDRKRKGAVVDKQPGQLAQQ
jgi:hypothetical protein